MKILLYSFHILLCIFLSSCYSSLVIVKVVPLYRDDNDKLRSDNPEIWYLDKRDTKLLASGDTIDIHHYVGNREFEQGLAIIKQIGKSK